ncbi:LysR family transcriptional regulator [Rhodoplanes roseus]|uniref:LysR family transcriptional regulator n=1 Tax=Rhodoplanes roseus TaxID=29409 RepID=A0A327KX18_9BRAD|nr:LysR family transcriptional regulator [Rhodoplanes roseus]
MVTLKQFEALSWIVQLGTFHRAALKLNTTQSAISKRIHELESAVGIAVLDRTQRHVRLTEAGARVLALGEEMLALKDQVMALRSGPVPVRRLRIGVTELTALTWLPRLVASLRETHPTLVLEPDVDMSRSLYMRLNDDEIDLIIIPEAFKDPKITALQLADVENVWMASPALVRRRKAMSLRELAQFTILTQGGRSGSGVFFQKWFQTEGIAFERVLSSDSLVALVGLTVAGMGISYLPKLCFMPLVHEGKLRVVPTRPALPVVPYVAMYRNDRPTDLPAAVARVAARVCDFSAHYQGEGLARR